MAYTFGNRYILTPIAARGRNLNEGEAILKIMGDSCGGVEKFKVKRPSGKLCGCKKLRWFSGRVSRKNNVAETQV